MMRAVVLVGPAAGAGRATGLADAVVAQLRAVADEVHSVVADSPAGSAVLAEKAVADRVDVLVVLGGDGLAHLGVQACAGSQTALAVVPAGTGNDLARALGMPDEPVTAAAVVAQSAYRPARLDLGRVAGGAWFATVLCVGFDAAVNRRANRMRWPHGRHRYDLAIMAELATFRPQRLMMESGGETLETEAMLVAVGNTGSYGGGIPICPHADATDGLLDITVVGACGRAELVRMLPRLRSGRHPDHPAVHTARASSVRLDAAGWFSYADGEPQGELPLQITSDSAALRVVTAH